MRPEDLFDDLIDELDAELHSARNRVSQDELDEKKVPAQDDSLAVVSPARNDSPAVRLPAVRPPTDNRRGRKAAEQEQARQWNMVQTTQRTALAADSMVAVTVHAQRKLDMAQEAMADRFYGVRRREAMNRFMGHVTSRCLGLAESGVMAILESHPKRIAEEL